MCYFLKQRAALSDLHLSQVKFGAGTNRNAGVTAGTSKNAGVVADTSKNAGAAVGTNKNAETSAASHIINIKQEEVPVTTKMKISTLVSLVWLVVMVWLLE